MYFLIINWQLYIAKTLSKLYPIPRGLMARIPGWLSPRRPGFNSWRRKLFLLAILLFPKYFKEQD